LEEVGREIRVNEIYGLPTPIQNLESIKTASVEHGLQTEQIGTYLIPIDLQTFVQVHVPVCVKHLVQDKNTSENIITSLTKEAIAKAINDPRALGDIKHKYDIVPIFRTVKK